MTTEMTNKKSDLMLVRRATALVYFLRRSYLQ